MSVLKPESLSYAEATRAAVADAGKTIRHMDWFEVVEQRGKIADGKVTEFQVTFKVGSRSSARINIAIAQA